MSDSTLGKVTSIALIGLGFTPAFTAVSTTATTLLKLIPLVKESSSLCATLHANVSIIEEKDMRFKLLCIETLLQSIAKDDSKLHNCPLVHVAVEGVHETVHAMTFQLQLLDKIISEHAEKYFASWRSLDISEPVDKLAKLYPILDQRYELLIKNISLSCSLGAGCP